MKASMPCGVGAFCFSAGPIPSRLHRSFSNGISARHLQRELTERHQQQTPTLWEAPHLLLRVTDCGGRGLVWQRNASEGEQR